MKNISIEMPLVSECSAVECAYNTDGNCHARAITIGNGIHPGCDTYFNIPPDSHTKAKQRIAGVGACKISVCRYNDDFECMAESIMVSRTGDQANCLTFTLR